MASEQLIKEELQNGVAASNQHSLITSYDDDSSTGALDRAAQLGVVNGIKVENTLPDEDDEADAEGEDEELEREEEETGDGDGDEEDDDDDAFESATAGEDEDGDEDEEIEATQISDLPRPEPKIKSEEEEEEEEEEDDDEDEEEEEDREEEDDEEEGDEESSEDVDEDTVDNAEGVGAVKIRPGETDEEDESEASAEVEESSDDEWEENAENEDEDEDDYGDDERTVQCILCKQAKKVGPDNEAVIFLTCFTCGEKAHEICAAEQGHPQEAGEPWKCAECKEDKDDSPATGDDMEVDAVAETAINDMQAQLPTNSETTMATTDTAIVGPAPKPVDGETEAVTRTLRKRKSSPTETDDSRMSLRKRRRNTTDDLVIDGYFNSVNEPLPSSARSLRIKPATSSLVSVVKKTKSTLILKMRVSGAELKRIFAKRRKYNKKGTPKVEKPPRAARPSAPQNLPHVSTSSDSILPLMPSSFTQPFYSFFDKETEEQKGKPYGGILTEAEADTSKTFPTAEDRKRFDEAKENAESEWRARLIQSEIDQPQKKSKKAAGPASQIECIEFGGWEIDTWYAAPYPEEYSRNRVLYICEFCLKYMNSDYVAWRHKLKCPAKHPPGDEIYRSKSVSFFEVDGRKNPVYCQNLCLLAKLFLGSKTLYYDVEPFLFYVLCEYDEFGYHFVGYFSKEKRASSQNNVSCILTLPIHQRKGYGNLLIDFSYLLTRVEEKTGSPEKPLSDMGLVSYRNYWRLVMCRYLLDTMTQNETGNFGLSIKQISDDTGMTADDVIAALEGMRCLVRDPQTGLYAFRVDLTYCREYVAKWEAKNHVTLDPEALTWTPYVMGRGNATNFELGPALTAIAPREDEEDEDEEEEEQKPNGSLTSLPNGTNSADEALVTNGTEEEIKSILLPAPTVLESTEPNDRDALSGEVDDKNKKKEDGAEVVPTDTAPTQSEEDSQPTNGDSVGENADVQMAEPTADLGASMDDAKSHQSQSQGEDTGTSTSTATPVDDWTTAYNNIPPTRFVVYPPMSSRRFNYARATIGRPPGSRTGHSGIRGRNRYGSGSGSVSGSGSMSRTPGGSGARPKTSSTGSRKKAGGTGRGPGRWPKGTKKSDYGNADSGPGLPPSWRSSHTDGETGDVIVDGLIAPHDVGGDEGHVLATDVVKPENHDDSRDEEQQEPGEEAGDDGSDDGSDDDQPAEDTVEVHTPTSTKLLSNGVGGAMFAPPNGRSSPGLGKGEDVQPDAEDVPMEDIDAEGEDE